MVDLLTIHKAQSELKETKQELDRLRQENDDLKRRLSSTANITDIVTNAIGTTLQPAYETITNLEDEVRRLNEKVKLLQTTAPGKSPLTETVLVLGGYANGHDYSDKLYLLDNDSSSWKQLSLSLPYSTRYHGSVCLKKVLYVFGGSLQGRSCNFLHRLTKEFQWERLTDMVDKRRYISNSSVALNGCIWAIGGKNDKNEDLKTVEKYDPDTKAWVLMQDMRQARFNAAATVIKGKIYVCGGASNGDLAIATVEFYDPQSGVWTYLSSMPFSRYNLALIADYTTLIVLGGRDCDQKTVGTCWKLNVSDLKSDWKPMKLMATPRCMFTAFKRADRIHVAGGYDGQKWQKTVDVFDGEKWTAGPEMPVQLSAMASVSLPNRLAVELTDRFTK